MIILGERKKRNVYFAQAAYKNGNTAYLPYAVGTIIAFAWADDAIKANYVVKDIIFLREDIDEIVNRLEDPVYFGFSSYLWNIEYNKALAKRVKERYPNCIIQFGGHQVSPDDSLLSECDYIDLLVHNEGEATIRQILLELLKDDECSFDSISNISYRKNGIVVDNEKVNNDLEDYPSPYLEGVFDEMMENHPEIEFIPLLETNRGCPNRCSYCGWGMYKSKIKLFSMDRIYKEIEWVAKHKMDFLGFADANFGLFERDDTIVDWIISFKKEYGYPKKFQVSYAKNSSSRIFEMTKKLNENGMDKGVTLAFQSLSQDVLDNINRSNISISYYTELLKRYTEAGIATYSDLILGLPGETYDSFKSGINTLLKAGQHSSLFIHILEWLPCSEMGSPAYMKKFGIHYVTIPLNQPHRRRSESINEVPEYSRVIVETNTMSKEDWVRMNLFSVCVLSFHYLGLLQFVAIYLYFEKGIEYAVFYQNLLDYFLKLPDSICGKIISRIREQLLNVVYHQGPVVCFDEELYGDIYWTMEEYVFLENVRQKNEVFEELELFLEEFKIDSEVFRELLTYQKEMIKTINQPYHSFHVNYNFPEYFSKRLLSLDSKLEKQQGIFEIVDPDSYSNWMDYARYVVWYGRRGGKNLYGDEVIYKTI